VEADHTQLEFVVGAGLVAGAEQNGAGQEHSGDERERQELLHFFSPCFFDWGSMQSLAAQHRTGDRKTGIPRVRAYMYIVTRKPSLGKCQMLQYVHKADKIIYHFA
jgi:hypothetical protein